MVLVVAIEIQSPDQALPVHGGPTPCPPSARIDGALCISADQDIILYRRNDAHANAKPDPVAARATEGHDARIGAKMATASSYVTHHKHTNTQTTTT